MLPIGPGNRPTNDTQRRGSQPEVSSASAVQGAVENAVAHGLRVTSDDGRFSRYLSLSLQSLVVCGLSLGGVLHTHGAPTILSSMGFLEEQQEAELLQWAAILLVAGGVTGTVLVITGAEQSIWRLVEVVGPALVPVLACLCFMVVGPALMLLNKHIMQEMRFPYPLTLSSLGLFASVTFSRILVRTGRVEVGEAVKGFIAGPGYWQVILPIAVCRSVTLATGNAVYLYLSVGFIQMLKALTPALILLVMVLARVELPSRPSVWCVLVIVLGTLVEVNGELQATLMGLGLMMTSCIGEAIATVYSQKMMQNFKFSEMETLYYLSLPSFLFLSCIGAVLEWPAILQGDGLDIFYEHPFIMVAASLLGVCVNLFTLMVVRATSSVTVKILNTLRCIVLVFVGGAFYGESHSAQQLGGYGVSLVGFVGYNFFQMRRDKSDALEAWVSERGLRFRGRRKDLARGSRDGTAFMDTGPQAVKTGKADSGREGRERAS